MPGATRIVAALCLCFALAGCAKEEKAKKANLGSVRWDSFPVAVKADDSLLDGGAREEDLLSAMAFWEGKAGKRLFQRGSWPSNTLPYTGDPTQPDDLLDNVIYLEPRWPQAWTERVAGKTVIFTEDARIRRAVVFLNGETGLCSGLCRDQYDLTSRRRLIAHELGHFLGFDHSDRKGNIMYPEILPGGSLEDQEVDTERLRTLTGD